MGSLHHVLSSHLCRNNSFSAELQSENKLSECIRAGPSPMARHQRETADLEAIASQFHGSNSSPQTSVSGQATPTSDSSPDAFNQRRPLPFAATDLSSRAGRAADGDGENGRETYELDEFGSDAIGDGEYGGDDDVKDAHMMDGRSRKKERRRSDSTAASFQLYTPDEERAVVRKFDRRLVIFLAFCYMLSFVDRSSTFFLLLSAFSPSLQWRRGPASIVHFPTHAP